MSLRIIVGVNWGDEGKGRMVVISPAMLIVGPVSGRQQRRHTIENDFGTFKLHLIPSGIFYKNTVNILGPGMVVQPGGSVKEMEELRKSGIEMNPANYK